MTWSLALAAITPGKTKSEPETMVAESWLSIATFVICEGGGMLELDIIGAWDARAVNLDQEEADRNVYEFDLTLWNLLSTLAKERPDDAASQ
ncbi:transcriptional regulator, partial [Vibrio sp. 1403]|nr:transcriptional regulator [Vibrio sp. 1403]